ncbi:MAG TPA: LamG-like jellyroll fold domain-containing protein [Pirellulales bacterium]|jgi:hypothetical protein|nr:LamG-like jellyroll fold domain-containing protein [Pirellulales bacterium]
MLLTFGEGARFAQAAFASAVLPGIVNEYRLDDGSGTIAGDSISGNSANLIAFGSGNSEWIQGFIGGGVTMTNQSAYIITSAPIAVSASNQFSVSFWERVNSVPNSNDSDLITPQGDNWISSNPSGNTNSSGKVGIGIRSVRDANNPLLGIWENYVVTYDRPSGLATVYRDGVLSDSGVISLPALNSNWVFGHNQTPSNANGSFPGSLDEIQIYNRVLSASDAATLASRPPQPGIAAHLVTPAQKYGNQLAGQFATASTTFYLDPANTQWVGWNRFPDLRATADSMPGQLLLGTYTPEVDDYFKLTVTNPLGQSLTLSMDQNDAIGNPTGLQSLIFGDPANDPTVVRGNNLGSPTFFQETGGFNSLFTVAGNYTFDFSFQNIGGSASYPNIYLLAQSVPEPNSATLAGLAGIGLLCAICWRKRRSDGRDVLAAARS